MRGSPHSDWLISDQTFRRGTRYDDICGSCRMTKGISVQLALQRPAVCNAREGVLPEV